LYLNLKYAQSLLVSLPCIVFFETNGCRSAPPPSETVSALDHSSAEAKDKFVPFIIEEIRAEHSFPEVTAAYNEDLRQRLQLTR